MTLISCAGGNALDVAGASKAAGANVQTYTPNGTVAQRFRLESTSLISAGGAVTLYAALAPSRVVDVRDGSSKSGAALQVYVHNGTAAQRFLVSEASGGAVPLNAVTALLGAPVVLSVLVDGARRG